MTIPPRPEDGPFHARHKCQPNTDPALIAAFKSAFPMHDCKPYGATITGEVCRRRRKMALQVPRYALKASIRQTWKTDTLMQVDKCLKCQSYYKPSPKPVPVKHGLCSCGCGREGRLVGRGKCSGVLPAILQGEKEMYWLILFAVAVACLHVWAMCAKGSVEDDIMRRDG